MTSLQPSPMSVRDLTCCFLRLSNVDNGAFERLGRYNAALEADRADAVVSGGPTTPPFSAMVTLRPARR